MNITELDSYNLADAVKFNRELNPALWQGDRLKPQVREHLLKIADEFREFLGLSNIELKDITVSGSNAAYTYTPHSDIDLHLVVDIPQADSDEIYRELFDAKKYQFNDSHNIKIKGYDVELYVENANKPPRSAGIYSVMNNDWIKIPRQIRATVDDEATESKYQDLAHRIESAVEQNDAERLQALTHKIKKMRESGLASSGEFGPENLAFKMLRSQGLIKKLYDARNAARDRELSLKEKQKINQPVVYGFKGVDEDLDTDGIMMTRQSNMSSESAGDNKKSDEDILRDFVDFCFKELKINKLPQIKLRKDPQWSVVNKTFGRYNDDRDLLEVAWGQRHIMDVLRTVAHELTHRRQHEREDVPSDAGETGSKYENEANARAGILMRDYARLHPEYFEGGVADDLEWVEEGWKEKAAALATAACVAGAPGCASVGPTLKNVQTAGRTANTIKGMTRQGVNQELEQELRNFVRAQGRGGDVAGAQNQSHLYKLQKRVQNEASGYIPTKKQKNDPRFKMALTVDVHPGQTGKEANKLQLSTDAQGHPDLLIKGLKNALREFKETGELPRAKTRYGQQPLTQEPGGVEDDLGNQEATGPEFPPQMPAGTTKIDVKDLTDWYRLGMDISDMDDADPEDYNQGPPQTVVVFPSDEAEQAYLKQFKRLGLKTHDMDPDVKGGEDVTGKHLREDEQLDEVRMSPSALQKFTASSDASGIVAGFEAEMIFRDTESDEDSGDIEPDYEADERADSIDDIINFFGNDDWGYGLSPTGERRLRSSLEERFYEWSDERMISEFNDQSFDLIRTYIEENEWDWDERIHEYLTSEMGVSDEEADEIVKASGSAPRFTKTSDQQEFAKENEWYAKYQEALRGAEDELDARAEESRDDQDGFYDAALDEFRDNWDYGDESEWLSDADLRYMSEVANEFGLDWPIMQGGGGNGGSRDWASIGDSLEEATGMMVRVGSGYHSTKRGDYYVIEPDGSLDPDDSEDYGLEIVSPPMPLNQAIEQLNKVIAWGNGEGNAYTNRSTGLHMGISIPYKGGDVDMVKLALFLGDEYILREFGRSANTYCKSALKQIREKAQAGHNRVKIDDAMALMRSGLIELADKYVNMVGVGKDKYTSIHVKPGYIEFRSPGGDYLSTEDRGEVITLEDTMRRFAYAMYLAGRPDLERKEYYKKLYKLIAPEGSRDLELFAKFSSGEITSEELKKQWAEKVISKEVPGGTLDKESSWKLYNADTNKPVPGAEYSGYKESEAWERARQAVAPGMSLEGFKKAYVLADRNANTGQWDIVKTDDHTVIKTVDAPNRGAAVDQAYDLQLKYDYYVRPHVEFAQPDKPAPKLSRRAQLAKQISAPKDYVIVKKGDDTPIYTFTATNLQQATSMAIDYVRRQDLEVTDYQVKSATSKKIAGDNANDAQQVQQRVQGTANNAPRADYELYVHDQPERVFHSMDDATAEEVREFIARQEASGMPPGLLRVRRAPESQPAFTGNWLIKDSSGRVLHSFGGIGNSQGDANRIATQWLRSNPGLIAGGVEVVPEMV